VIWQKIALAAVVGLGSCAQTPDAHANEMASRPTPPASPGPRPSSPPEPHLGVSDRGIFSDLDDRVQLTVPAEATSQRASAMVDQARRLLILYVDGWPVKPYPLTGTARLERAGVTLMLRPGDRAELSPLLTHDNVELLAEGRSAPPGDADHDGLPDPLDLLIGGHKTALNQARYGAGYMKLDYPMGDVPRDKGVCTDVVIRAARNAGLDIQSDLQRDIQRSRRSYPMVKGKGDRNIDHRRVKTLLPYFKRRWNERSPAIDDPADPLRPGDIVLMDTFPSRSGPDHIGVVSDRLGQRGKPLIINNWTDGTVTTEMDLLGWVPVTHRFRFHSRPAR
jgi:uncharacterized protein YijF (DUF1287 family)